MSAKRPKTSSAPGPLPFWAASRILRGYQDGAKRRGLTFNLSREVAVTLLHANCYYCGIPPFNIIREFRYNGIDRIDNDADYEEWNVVTCCGPCNRAKSDMPKARFAEWVRNLKRQRIK